MYKYLCTPNLQPYIKPYTKEYILKFRVFAILHHVLANSLNIGSLSGVIARVNVVLKRTVGDSD